MTASSFSMTGAPSSRDDAWSQIHWQQAQSQVGRLQMRIAKAVRTQKWGKVKTLQLILTHSYHAKLLAVKRVPQSSGAKTPGIDGVLWRTAEQKICAASSLQRLRLQSTNSAAHLNSQKERETAPALHSNPVRQGNAGTSSAGSGAGGGNNSGQKLVRVSTQT